ENDKNHVPIIADPAIVLDWPQNKWRDKGFEFFAWDQFPSVLIFDFADYAVQDDFLKRLAFYVEKNGYTGHLWTTKELEGLQSFTAQDYKAESLAEFFTQAYDENFALNESELLLKDILLENGIIVHNPNGVTEYIPGEGAIISIARESADYLRRILLTHEALHGIYFTHEIFRDKVTEVYNATHPTAVSFLRRYFEVTPSLNYDTDDAYLMQNEYMAYILQYSPYAVESYYADTLVNRYYIAAREPELCNYVRQTRASDFVTAAFDLSNFLFEQWGLYGGRVHTLSITRNAN
ncbi:MAG: hypothetical protein R3Y36_01360, partial [Spirochaetales bacterium]